MIFNYHYVESELKEKDLETLKSYMEKHQKEILDKIDEIDKMNEIKVNNKIINLIPISVVYRDEKEYLTKNYHSFLLSKNSNEEVVDVELTR